MTERKLLTSVTRISDLAERPFKIEPRPRETWDHTDYVVVHIDRAPRGLRQIELATGRMAEVGRDAYVVGALGVRHATLEAVGSWEDVGPERRLQFLTSAGLLGRATSLSNTLPSLLEGRYVGHVVREAAKLSMEDFARPPADAVFGSPTVLLVGTSMSAGKTTTGKVVVRHLKRAGLRVVASKLSGAGRYRDALGMQDAGADAVFDFVDVGLPSSVVPPEVFRPKLRTLLSLIAAARPDVLVAEAGASPLEPYNGRVVLEELGENVACIILAASDPYAVVGVIQGFGMRPDLVAGLATCTSAGVELVEKLTGLPALNVLDPDAQPALVELLELAVGRVRGPAPD